MTLSTVAVVLAGGDGRRMGGGKPLASYGRTTLLARAVRLARGYCPTVAVAVRAAEQVGDGLAEPLILDRPGAEGPIAGLAAALAYAEREGGAKVLTLPCDMPRLPADLCSRLEAALAASGRVAAVAASGGRLHPVCALWRIEAAQRLEGYLASGRSSLHGFAAACGFSVVDWDPGDADPFANANTPEELAALQPSRGAG